MNTTAFRVLVVALVIYFGLAAFPPGPQPASTGLDPSWVAGLNMAHAQGLVAGKDWVFTLGPLGYLSFPESESGALGLGLLYRIGLCGVWGIVLLVLALRAPSAGMGLWVVAVFGCVATIDDYMYSDRLELTIAAMALLPFWKRTRWRYLELSLFAVLAGFSLMVKFNTGVEAVALLVVVLGITAWGDRENWKEIRWQACMPLAILVVSTAGFYWVASGGIGSFGRYLYYSWQIAEAYSESMGLVGPEWQAHLALAAIALPVVVLWWLGDAPRRCLAATLPAGVIAFFFFKHAFVRQHDSRVISLLAQLAVVLLFALVLAGTRRDRKIIALLQVLLILGSMQMSLAVYPKRGQPFASRFSLHSARVLVTTYLYLRQSEIALEDAGNANLAAVRLDARFHQAIGDGTVEAAPWDITAVRANAWRWRPRPIFQTYQACGPSLDLLNAEHLESERAADFILLGGGEIDGRHEFLSDPRSWRAMFDRYDLALATPERLLLRRRATPRFGRPVDAGYATARWNEEIVIPQDQPVMLMSVGIRRTINGELSGLFFRNAPTFAVVTYRSGEKERWRAVASNLAAGFPINPFARNLGDIARLWSGQAPADRAASIRFEADDLGEYGDTLAIHWVRLPPAK
jgi:hypothetical protein